MDIGLPMALVTPAGVVEFNGFSYDGDIDAEGDFSGDGFGAGGYYRLTNIDGLDFASMRANADPRPQADGGIVYDAYLGPRYPTLTGVIVPDSGTEDEMILSRRQMQGPLSAALQSILRTDGYLTWAPRGVVGSPTAEEANRVLTVRAWQPLQIGGMLMKEFQLGLVAADPTIYGAAHEVQDTSTPFSLTATNDGDVNSFPEVFFNAEGEVEQVTLQVTGAFLTTGFQLNDFTIPSSLLDNTGVLAESKSERVGLAHVLGTLWAADVGGTLLGTITQIPGGTHFPVLGPGSNTVIANYTAGGGGLTPHSLTIRYRDAWSSGV